MTDTEETGHDSEIKNQDDLALVERMQEGRDKIVAEIKKVIIGQEDIIDELLIALFGGGHVLVTGVPGLAKTLLIKTVADILQVDFSRIQFTPDLMPADVVGSEVVEEGEHGRKLTFVKGPIFTNILLADEINRTPPKTQSSLLEAMEERQVTAAGVTHPMSKPFFVLATQNPIELEGTYPLPEAQLDRFMFNIFVDYPSFSEELAIVKATTSDDHISLNQILSAEDIVKFQNSIRKMPVADNVLEYAVRLVGKTRVNSDDAPKITKDFITWGAGPRASQYLIVGAKCHAAIRGKYSPDIEDVKAVAMPILRHRLVRNYRAEAEGYSMEKIIQKLL